MRGRRVNNLGIVMSVASLVFHVSVPGLSFELWHASTVAREERVVPKWTAHAEGPSNARALSYAFTSRERALAWLQAEMNERLTIAFNRAA
jgi:hypothetical protein